MTANRATSPLTLVAGRRDWRAMLEADYQQVAGRLASAYDRMLPELRRQTVRLATRIVALEQEGRPVTPDLLQTLDEYNDLRKRIEAEMQDFGALARLSAGDLRDAAIQAGMAAALDGVADQSQIAAGVWMHPDPEALTRLLVYTDSDAMRERFARFGANAGQDFADLMLSLTAQGKNARWIAQALDGWLNVPYAWAETMTRTVQIYSYRGATSAAYKANARVLDGWMWWAALDGNVCMSCVSQHGSIHSVSETLDDHYRGRCAMVPVVKGADWPDEVQSGEAWYDGLDEARQRALAGDLLWTALKHDDVGWGDLSQEHHDDVFGTMLREASVRELVGDNRYISLRVEAAR